MKGKVRYLLVEARKKKGIGVIEMAQKLNVHRTHVWKLEGCATDGSINEWRKIQKILSIKDKDMWAIINSKKVVNL